MKTTRCKNLPAALLVLAVLCGGAVAQSTLTTTFVGGNGQSGAMFDLEANGGPTLIIGLDLHFNATVGTTLNVDVYAVTGGGSHAAVANSGAGWTLLANSNVVSAGMGSPTPFPASLAIMINPGTPQGLYVTLTSGTSQRYTNGAAGSYQSVYVSNADLTVRAGMGKALPAFTGGNFGGPTPGVSDSRNFNGNIHYIPGTVPNNGPGQPPQPGLATFDINGALDVDGLPVGVGANGPHSVNVAAGQLMNFAFGGTPGQPIILLAGVLNPAAATFPGIGQIDIGSTNPTPPFIPGGLQVLANGADGSGFLGGFFVLGGGGSVVIGLGSSGLPPGLTYAFQAVMFTGGPSVVALSNCVVVNTL